MAISTGFRTSNLSPWIVAHEARRVVDRTMLNLFAFSGYLLAIFQLFSTNAFDCNYVTIGMSEPAVAESESHRSSDVPILV